MSVTGLANLDDGNHKSAIKHLKQSIVLLKRDNRTVDVARMTNQLGRAYHGLENFEMAEIFYSQAQAQYKTLGDKVEGARIQLNKAILLLNLGRINEATINLNQISKHDLKHNHQYDILGSLYHTQGECHLRENRDSEAEENFINATEFWMLANSKLLLANTFLSLVETYLKQQNKSKQSYYAKEAKTLLLQYPDNHFATMCLAQLNELTVI